MTTSIACDQLRCDIEGGSVIVVDALPAGLYSRRHIPGTEEDRDVVREKERCDLRDGRSHRRGSDSRVS